MTGSQIRTELTRIIDNLILSNNPEVLDDEQSDLLADGDKREEAIGCLVKMIELYREDI